MPMGGIPGLAFVPPPASLHCSQLPCAAQMRGAAVLLPSRNKGNSWLRSVQFTGERSDEFPVVRVGQVTQEGRGLPPNGPSVLPENGRGLQRQELAETRGTAQEQGGQGRFLSRLTRLVLQLLVQGKQPVLS